MAWLSLVLFLPLFALLGALFWFYPRTPRNAARQAFDSATLLLALVLSILGMHWGYGQGAADAHSGPIWRQVLAVLYAFYSCKLAWQSHAFQDISTGSDATPLWLPQLAMAFGTSVLAIAFVDELVLELLGRRQERPAGEALRNE